MPTRYIKRSTALDGGQVSRANSNAVFVDSDDDQLKFTTGTSGTTTVDVVTESQTQTLTNKTLTAPTITAPAITGAATIASGAVFTSPVINSAVIAAGATLTIAAATHDNRVVLLDTAAGSTVTLPAATGSGLRVKFVVSVTPTSNQHRIDVTGNDAYFGTVVMDTDADSVDLGTITFPSGPTITDADRIDLNGTTKGGDKGDWLEVIDIATDSWHVSGVLTGTGTEVTPFTTGAVA